MKKAGIAIKVILRFLVMFVFAGANLWINARAFPYIKAYIATTFPNAFGAVLLGILFVYFLCQMWLFGYLLVINLQGSCKKYKIPYS